MKRTAEGLLTAYYYASFPYRRRHAAQLARAGNAPIMVLFYHRVADEALNDWTLPTSQFERQIDWLRRHVDLVSLEEAQARIRGGVNYRPAVSLTFDDGYADNCDAALPLLIRHRLPCTYFVSLHHVQHGVPFPHDVAANRPLRPNTIEDLRRLARAGIEIGGHTRHHANLGRISDEDRLYDEVVRAGRELADLVDQPVRFFAFPYGLAGDLNARAFQLAREAGYRAACSAGGGYNFPGGDPFHLQRIHADPQWIRWKNWLTVDPRKLRAGVRFDYDERQPANEAEMEREPICP
jgi:peptidoglycan/xylan/chitin deacetylase (PgdA/CDA1 family)